VYKVDVSQDEQRKDEVLPADGSAEGDRLNGATGLCTKTRREKH
jgi:hypothetical protein